MSADPRAIGCFDSGLGGLTVVRALLDLLPDERLVYFGDTGRFPYGPKPAEDVLKYSIEISDLLMARDVKMIVVACNSASAAALEHLRDHVPVPVTGVIEPGIRAARRATSSGRIGVIGTVGTIASGAYQRAAAAIDPSLELTCAACPGFVEFVTGESRPGRRARAGLHPLPAARPHDRRRDGPRRRARLERRRDGVRGPRCTR
jgi:glutamate racemase